MNNASIRDKKYINRRKRISNLFLVLGIVSSSIDGADAWRSVTSARAAATLSFRRYRPEIFTIRGGDTSNDEEDASQGNVAEVKESDLEDDGDTSRNKNESGETVDNSMVSDATDATSEANVDEVQNLATTSEATSDEDLDEEELSKLNAIREAATTLRLRGKELHDEGNFAEAAGLFQQASDTLAPSVEDFPNERTLSEELATCLLHESLCHLKGAEYARCIDACTSVLQDSDDISSPLVTAISVPAIRARAYHRRAKAKLGLEDTAGALQDARSAAFLGDRKGVALYGRLMRELPPSWISDNDARDVGGDGGESILQSLLSSSGQPSPSASLIESLLGKSSAPSASPLSALMGDFSPASMLLGKKPLGEGKPDGGLAKSVLQNLSKRLEDENMQETVCQYLQRLNKGQLQTLISMTGAGDAGISDEQLDKLVSFCHGVTPKGIRRAVRLSKRTIYGVQLFRKLGQVLSRYRSLIVMLVVMQWIKSAIRRPLPVNKRAARRALKEALKASRP